MEIQDGTPRPGKMFLSIVVPCYNEEEGLREFHHQMTAAARALCGQRFELILIDDGSTDDTWKLINQLSAEDRNVVAVRLSRNHGHQLALTADSPPCAATSCWSSMPTCRIRRNC